MVEKKRLDLSKRKKKKKNVFTKKIQCNDTQCHTLLCEVRWRPEELMKPDGQTERGRTSALKAESVKLTSVTFTLIK